MENPNQEIAPVISTKKHVVVYGKHEYILNNVQNLINKADMTSAGFTSLDETLDYMRMNPLDAILIGGGVEPQDRSKILEVVKVDVPHVKVVEHYGGPATILSELRSVLGS
jgi:hypothetical protein